MRSPNPNQRDFAVWTVAASLRTAIRMNLLPNKLAQVMV
jgi:hypothetical protein